ncbi:MAG: hypothetical protein AAF039_13865 [Bacteroidota bacterium]
MIRILVFSIFLALIVPRTFSQNTLRDEWNGVYYNPTLYAQEYGVEDGSPYLDLDFKPAKIGKREKTHLVRFNGYKGNVEVWVKENQVIVLETPQEEQIALLDGSEKVYMVRKYRNPKGAVSQGFLEVLQSSDTYTLYKKEIIKFFKKTKAEGYAAAKPARFEKGNPQFYLKASKDQMPIHLPSSKKKFLAVFGPKTASKAKAIIKKERVSLSKEDDLIKIMDGIYN